MTSVRLSRPAVLQSRLWIDWTRTILSWWNFGPATVYSIKARLVFTIHATSAFVRKHRSSNCLYYCCFWKDFFKTCKFLTRVIVQKSTYFFPIATSKMQADIPYLVATLLPWCLFNPFDRINFVSLKLNFTALRQEIFTTSMNNSL